MDPALGLSSAACIGDFPPCTHHTHGAVWSACQSTRAMVTTGRWQQQAADPALYGGILNGSGHEADVATYVHYAGALPDFPTSGSAPA